jgi:hypothetical protein
MNLLVVPLVAMEGYSSKFTIFNGATPPQKMQIWWHLYEEKRNFWLYFAFNYTRLVKFYMSL